LPRLDGFLPSESLLSLVSIRLPEGIKLIWYLKTRESLLSLVTPRLASSKADNKRWPPMQPGSAPRLTSEYSHKLNSKKFYITLPTLPTALHLPLKIVSGYASYGGHVRAVTNTGARFEPRLVMTVSTDVGHEAPPLGAPSINPDNHNDEAKSKRQMAAFFDVDRAANNHDGRSLKAERSGKKLSKRELKDFQTKRREKKEEKRRAWLRD